MSQDGAGDFPASAFWDFTLAVYGRPGVAPACIALQDRRGLHVNMLLFCCWAAASGRGALDADDLDRACAVARPWQETVVAPLREVRRRLKTVTAPAPNAVRETVRRGILAAEINAEHVEQLMIEATSRRNPDAGRSASVHAADAVAGLAHYLSVAGVAIAADDRADLTTLLAATFPDCTPAELAASLDAMPCGDA